MRSGEDDRASHGRARLDDHVVTDHRRFDDRVTADHGVDADQNGRGEVRRRMNSGAPTEPDPGRDLEAGEDQVGQLAGEGPPVGDEELARGADDEARL